MKKILFVAFAIISMGQAARPTDKFEWQMDAPELVIVQLYRYELELNSILLTNQLVATCEGVPPTFTCKAPIPPIGAGKHIVRVRAVDLTDGIPIWSEWSEPLGFTMRATPTKPSNLHIVSQ